MWGCSLRARSASLDVRVRWMAVIVSNKRVGETPQKLLFRSTGPSIWSLCHYLRAPESGRGHIPTDLQSKATAKLVTVLLKFVLKRVPTASLCRNQDELYSQLSLRAGLDAARAAEQTNLHNCTTHHSYWNLPNIRRALATSIATTSPNAL